MLIKTENHSTLWKYWKVFDTDTGLRYSLHYPIVNIDEFSYITLSIDSAHLEITEDGYPMTYRGKEALDFWEQLDDNRTDWVKEAHKEATEVLRQIQKEEAKAAREERHPELDDLDGIPF